MIRRNLLAVVASAAACLAVGVAGFAQTPKPAMPKATPPAGKMAGQKGGMATGKKMPARDPKTGRFMKASPAAPAMAGKKGGMAKGGMAKGKTMPPRDPKTGRFMKATPKPKM